MISNIETPFYISVYITKQEMYESIVVCLIRTNNRLFLVKLNDLWAWTFYVSQSAKVYDYVHFTTIYHFDMDDLFLAIACAH